MNESARLSRTPPTSVRRQLRQEVGFGCPVDGCGSPYLSWHHFDPPWAIEHHHDPARMIALCRPHADQADGGAFTEEQIREMKARPFMRNVGAAPKGRFNWRRRNLLVHTVGDWFVGPSVLLTVGEQNLIWLTEDEHGFSLLNFDLFEADGALLAQMRDNDWILQDEPEDLECRVAGSSLFVRSRGGVRISMKFSKVEFEELRTLLGKGPYAEQLVGTQGFEWWLDQTMPLLKRALPPDEEIALCRLKGKLMFPIRIEMRDHYAILPRGNVLAGNVHISRDAGLLFPGLNQTGA